MRSFRALILTVLIVFLMPAGCAYAASSATPHYIRIVNIGKRLASILPEVIILTDPALGPVPKGQPLRVRVHVVPEALFLSVDSLIRARLTSGGALGCDGGDAKGQGIFQFSNRDRDGKDVSYCFALNTVDSRQLLNDLMQLLQSRKEEDPLVDDIQWALDDAQT